MYKFRTSGLPSLKWTQGGARALLSGIPGLSRQLPNTIFSTRGWLFTLKEMVTKTISNLDNSCYVQCVCQSSLDSLLQTYHLKTAPAPPKYSRVFYLFSILPPPPPRTRPSMRRTHSPEKFPMPRGLHTSLKSIRRHSHEGGKSGLPQTLFLLGTG